MTSLKCHSKGQNWLKIAAGRKIAIQENTREQHQSCNNPSIYKSAIEKVMFHNDTLLEVRNFMRGSIEFENELLNIKMERQQGPRSIPSKSPNDQNTPLNTEATSSFGASKSSSP